MRDNQHLRTDIKPYSRLVNDSPFGDLLIEVCTNAISDYVELYSVEIELKKVDLRSIINFTFITVYLNSKQFCTWIIC